MKMFHLRGNHWRCSALQNVRIEQRHVDKFELHALQNLCELVKENILFQPFSLESTIFFHLFILTGLQF